MQVRNAIMQRRSIRSYTEKPVSEEEIREILNAGFYAPTARNMRPTHFIVIRNQAVLKQIAHEQPNAKYCTDAGCGILVCGDTEKDVEGYLVEDGSAAIENMLLTAYELNLGALWCGVYPRVERMESFRRLCSLPDSILPVGFVIIGNTDEKNETPQRYDENAVHWEQW